MHRPLRLTSSKSALLANYRYLRSTAGVRTGAAIKANGYGLGAQDVLAILYEAGCRDFFVSTWWEAQRLGDLPEGASIAVLHGVGPADLEYALQSKAKPVLNSVYQAQRWRARAPGRPCDVMIDTGMNRLGFRPEEGSALADLNISTLHSHLACADEDHSMNERQLDAFRRAASEISAQSYSLANSAGILLGRKYSFDLVRPGLGLYGGVPRPEARPHLRRVFSLEAQVLQRRVIKAGETCGYGASFTAPRDVEAAIVNIGYADGYWRAFSAKGIASAGGASLPVLGRVSMDLVALGCDDLPDLTEGDWVMMDFDLENAAAQTGKTQYELLTGLGARFERAWH